MEAIANVISEYDGTRLTFVEYKINNEGDTPATGIRLSSSRVRNAELFRQSGPNVSLKIDQKEDYYRIPDLNPREETTLFVWISDALGPRESYRSASSYPALTYRGSEVETNLHFFVSEGYHDLADFVDDLHPLFLIILIIAAGWLIAFVSLLLIAIAEALLTGKPLKSIFSQNVTSSDKASLADGK